jgi:D-xylonolactonase
MTSSPESICTIGATLGEGPVWSESDGALWFVDIKGRQIHRFDADRAALTSWPAPAQPGWVLPASDSGWLAGLQTGVHRFDPRSGRFDLLFAPEAGRPGNRLNDATVDAVGRLWFGSMDDSEEHPTGLVYLFDGTVRDSGIAPVVITNGPAISPDGQTLYHVDTLARRIWSFPLTLQGQLGPARLFAEIEPGAGYPDGPTVDAEGHLWIGLFGGWGVRRYAPDGKLAETVRFPVANVTKIAFGGPDLTTAFATTARKGLDPAALAEQPLAGDLFRFDAGVKGMPSHRIKLS